MRLEENLDSRPEKAQHLEFEQKRLRVGQISQINQREAKERVFQEVFNYRTLTRVLVKSEQK